MSSMRARPAHLLVLLLAAVACSDEVGDESATSATGGSVSGGTMSTGGTTGGVVATGGTAMGGTQSGGTPTGGSSGGTPSTGGAKASGGVPPTGGTTSTGGARTSGGSGLGGGGTSGGSALGGGGTGGGATNPAGGGNAGVSAAGSSSRTLGFEADIWPVFALIRDPIFVYYDDSTYESCVTNGVCHGGSTPGAGLRMPDPDTAYEQLLNVPSRTSLCDDTLRVVPGDPEQSCLILFYRQRLRTELDWVSQSEIDLVSEWIAAGARP